MHPDFVPLLVTRKLAPPDIDFAICVLSRRRCLARLLWSYAASALATIMAPFARGFGWLVSLLVTCMLVVVYPLMTWVR